MIAIVIYSARFAWSCGHDSVSFVRPDTATLRKINRGIPEYGIEQSTTGWLA